MNISTPGRASDPPSSIPEGIHDGLNDCRLEDELTTPLRDLVCCSDEGHITSMRIPAPSGSQAPRKHPRGP